MIADATANPWPYGDLAEIGVGSNIATTALSSTPQLGAQLSGTVSWTSGNNVVTTTADLRASLSGQSCMGIAWDSSDGPGTGRIVCPISSVSATQVTCSVNIFRAKPAAEKALTSCPAPDSNGLTFQTWLNGNPATIWNYYDVGIALYRLYYRTGNNAFLTQAGNSPTFTGNGCWITALTISIRRAASNDKPVLPRARRPQRKNPRLYTWSAKLASLFWEPRGSPAIDNREAGYTLWDVASERKPIPMPRGTRNTAPGSTPTSDLELEAVSRWKLGRERIHELNPSYVSAPKTFYCAVLLPGRAVARSDQPQGHGGSV